MRALKPMQLCACVTLVRKKNLSVKTYYLAGAMSKPSYDDVKWFDPKSCTDLKCDDENKCSCVNEGKRVK